MPRWECSARVGEFMSHAGGRTHAPVPGVNLSSRPSLREGDWRQSALRAGLQSPADGTGATSPMTRESFSFAAQISAWRSAATPCVDVVNSASRTRLLT